MAKKKNNKDSMPPEGLVLISVLKMDSEISSEDIILKLSYPLFFSFYISSPK